MKKSTQYIQDAIGRVINLETRHFVLKVQSKCGADVILLCVHPMNICFDLESSKYKNIKACDLLEMTTQ